MGRETIPTKKSGIKYCYYWLCQNLTVNPYYFGFLFFALVGLNFIHFSTLDRSDFSPYLFLIYALGQSAFEVGILILIASLIKKFCHRSIFYLFISCCFFFLILHYIDFLLIRFMDMSIYYAIDLAIHETWDNFVELIRLSEIKLQKWIIFIVFCTFFLPLLAIGLYWLLEKAYRKRPVVISHRQLLATLIVLPIALIVLDIAGTSRFSYKDYRYYCRLLPWKSTLVVQQGEMFKINKALKPPLNEKEIDRYLGATEMKLEKRPNIYLFVIESLREDFISPAIAPNIARLSKENISLGQTFSSANATQQSWYAIFHSNHALYWSYSLKDRYQSGSLPLRLLKKLGYQIHVYSAAQLKYYHLSEIIFGKGHKITDSYHIYPHYFPVKAWQSDEQAVGTFLRDFDQTLSSQGNLCIFFLDSTHFNYSWPDHYQTPFQPFSEEGTNLQISNTEHEIALLQNRYRNSIHYADSLVGKVIDKIKAKGLYDESVIVITGDHGEEFFEEGQLFHASHLSRVQTRVPIYYKLGDNRRALSCDLSKVLSSHVDIFPTLLDYLIGEPLPKTLWSGDSIFASNRFPFVVAARYNGGKAPSTFFIHNGSYKLTARIKSSRRFSGKTVLEILSIRNVYGQTVPSVGFSAPDHPFHLVYAPALNQLFCND
ncbi:MAG: sulfatase-like hydrolase/transferase [Chlamydiota bacterium]